jgi:hypothetical protein
LIEIFVAIFVQNWGTRTKVGLLENQPEARQKTQPLLNKMV